MASLVAIAIAGPLTFAACKNNKKSTPEPTATTAGAETPAATAPSGTTPSAGGPDAPPPVSATPTVTASGLKIIDVQAGAGAAAAAGKTVTVNYTLWLSDGTKVDSSLDRGKPFSFVLQNEPPDVISGWDEGVVGMAVGSKRRLIVPPDLAYGAEGKGTIPPNAELTFDIDLLSVE
jgi:FKBP-type peptidyl-prolyl cis-trans isomerase